MTKIRVSRKLTMQEKY